MNVAPTLAIDIASSSASAVLHIPDAQAQGLFAFRCPASGKVLVERIRECTALRRPLHIFGSTLDASVVPALKAHLKAGLRVSVHPEYAALLTADPEKLLGMGISIINNPPDTAVVLESWDISPENWYQLMDMAGLPRPGRLLACATETGYLLDAAEARPVAPWLQGLFESHPDGIPLPELASERVNVHGEAPMLRLSSIQRITGFSVLDSAIAFVFGMHALASVAGRSRREGVVLLYMGRHFIRAALLYRNRLFALLELPARLDRDTAGRLSDCQAVGLDPQTLMHWLDDLRLGWLPLEKAAARGGFLCRAESLPAEAEGFRPLFISGPEAISLEGFGRITDSGPEESANCRGLLAAFPGP